MKKILAFGDSNTWGLIPGSGNRYPEHIRWTGILQKAVAPYGYRVLEDGVCGRTTVFRDPSRSGRKGLESIAPYRNMEGLAGVILMLGTNDCKAGFHAEPEEIGAGLEQCLTLFEGFLPPQKILVVSPLRLGQNIWRPEKDPAFSRLSVGTCAALKDIYSRIAFRRGNIFLASSDFAAASPLDDEHMNAEGHERFAAAVLEKLKVSGFLAS